MACCAISSCLKSEKSVQWSNVDLISVMQLRVESTVLETPKEKTPHKSRFFYIFFDKPLFKDSISAMQKWRPADP